MIETRTVGWAHASPAPPLEVGVVHLWLVDLDGREASLDTLDEKERQRAARYRFAIHRRRFAAGRSVLRQLIGAYVGVDPAGVVLRYGAAGKPALAAPVADLRFNASGSAGLALYAFSREVELGVDLELAEREVEHDRIVRRRFAAIEGQAIAASADEHRAFLACWTRKEAYGKVTGVGIGYPLSEVVLCERFDRASFAVNDPAGERLTLVQLQPPGDTIAALAIRGELRPLRGWVLAD